MCVCTTKACRHSQYFCRKQGAVPLTGRAARLNVTSRDLLGAATSCETPPVRASPTLPLQRKTQWTCEQILHLFFFVRFHPLENNARVPKYRFVCYLLKVQQGGATMWIQVRTIDGKETRTVEDLSRLTKIESLRLKIQDIFNVSPPQQRLFYRGKQVMPVLVSHSHATVGFYMFWQGWREWSSSVVVVSDPCELPVFIGILQ